MTVGELMKTILIADDQKDIVSILSQYCEKEGYRVIPAFDGEQALALFAEHDIDCVCLDVMMPNLDGFEVCRTIRKSSMVPIIMITAKGEDFEKIMGLELGADDYMVKPFSPRELIARIRAIFRRLDHTTNQFISIGGLVIDPSAYSVQAEDYTLSLTKKEFEILSTLAQHVNRVFSREDLLSLVWGYDYLGDDRTVDAHIKRLRQKCEQIPNKRCQITTIWGVGYKFEVLDENT